MILQFRDFWTAIPRQWIPFCTCLLLLILTLWLVMEGTLSYVRYTRARRQAAPATTQGSFL